MSYMLISIISLLLLVIPGLLILGLLNIRWADKFHPNANPLIWFALPMGFSLSLGLISLAGYSAYFLDFGFSGAKALAIGMITLLLIIVLYFLGKNIIRWLLAIFNNLFIPASRNLNLVSGNRSTVNKPKHIGLSIGLLTVGLTVLVAYTGPYLSLGADSFFHIAAIRSLVNHNRPLPQEIFLETNSPTLYIDSHSGSWHLALALVANMSGTDELLVWRFAHFFIAAMMVLAYSSMAYTITRRIDATLFATILFFILGRAVDVRSISNPNLMGQVIIWLIITTMIVFAYSVDTIEGRKNKGNKDSWKYLVILAILGFTLSSIHMQYPPVLISLLAYSAGVLLLSNICIVVIKKFRLFHPVIGVINSIVNNNNGLPQTLKIKELSGSLINNSSLLKFIIATVVVVVSELPIFIYRSIYLTSNPLRPIVKSSSLIIASDGFPSLQELLEAVNYKTYATYNLAFPIAALLLLLLLKKWLKGDVGASIVIAAVLLAPTGSVLLTALIGSGGLVLNTIGRMVRLTIAFLYLIWGWQLIEVIQWIKGSAGQSLKVNLLVISYFVLILLVSLNTFNQLSDDLYQFYLPGSNEKNSLAYARSNELTNTRADALAIIQALPPKSTILTDANTSYEIAGLTGKYVISMTLGHIPLEEKEPLYYNGSFMDQRNFISGSLNREDEIIILDKYGVEYVYIDLETSSSKLWNHLPSVFPLEEQARGEKWRLYKYNPDLAKVYLDLYQKKENGQLGSFSFYRDIANLYTNKEQLADFVSEDLNIDQSKALNLIVLGENYQSFYGPNVYYNFVDNLTTAVKEPPDDEGFIRQSVFIIDNEPHSVLFQHAPSTTSFIVPIKPNSQLLFTPSLAPDVWKLGNGDGVLFEIYLESDGKVYRIYSEYFDSKNLPSQRKWFKEKIELNQWALQTAMISFITEPGPNNDARFDWAGWGEPRMVQPIAYDFLTNLSVAVLKEGVTEEQVREDSFSINDEARQVLFVHPSNRVSYSLNLPDQSVLAFGIGMDPEVWSPEQGDGVDYKVFIRPHAQPNTLYQVFHRYIDPKNNPAFRRWFDERVDLSQFGGQAVEVIFEAGPGPEGNLNFDWGGWSNPVLLDETLPGLENAELPVIVQPTP